MKKSIVVDLFGLSGSGKTTLMHKMIDELSNQGYVCAAGNSEIFYNGKLRNNRKIGKYLRAVRAFSAASLKYGLSLLRLLISIKAFDKTSLRYAASSFYYFLQLQSGLSRAEVDVIFSDNGFVQYIVEIMYRKQTAPCILIDEIIDCINKEFGERLCFVYVDTSLEDAYNRIEKRGKMIRLSSLNKNEAIMELIKERTELIMISEIVRNAKYLKLLQVKNEGDEECLNNSAYKIANIIKDAQI